MCNDKCVMRNEKRIMTSNVPLLDRVRALHITHYALFLLISTPSFAQNPAPSTLPVGQFLADSIEIGRPFRYALSFRHPIAVPFGLIKTSLNVAWRLTGFGGEPAWIERVAAEPTGGAALGVN